MKSRTGGFWNVVWTLPVALVLFAGLYVTLFPAAPSPETQSVPWSTYDTSLSGLDNLYSLLDQTHPMRTLSELPSTSTLIVETGSTVFIVGDYSFDSSEVTQLKDLVASGVNVVFSLIDAPPRLDSAPGPASPTEVTADVRITIGGLLGERPVPMRLRGPVDGIRQFTNLGEALPIAVTSDGATVAADAIGEGIAWFLADPDLLTNRWLYNADNASLPLLAAGPDDQAIFFYEPLTPPSPAVGFATLPPNVKSALFLLGLAALVYAVSVTSRFGPVERNKRMLEPSRSEYASALGTRLARIDGASRPAGAYLAARLRTELQRRSASDDPADLREAGRRAGVSDHTINLALSSVSPIIPTAQALAQVLRTKRTMRKERG
jgi:uncharacterized protein DUF4350